MAPKERHFRDPTTITKWVTWSHNLSIAMAVATIISQERVNQVLDAAVSTTGLRYRDFIESLDELALPILGASVIVWFSSAILSWIWTYRASSNAAALRPEAMTITPGWSVGWYFVPLAAIGMPLKAMQEIWRVSIGANDNLPSANPRVLGWWWGSYLCWYLLWKSSDIYLRFTVGLDSEVSANHLFQMSLVALAVFFYLFSVIARRVCHFQLLSADSKWANSAVEPTF
jgi:hypothetical protein